MAKENKKQKNQNSKKPRVNEELDGFDISIDRFGEIKSSFDIEKINAFLNKNVEDKKLKDRTYIEEIKKGKSKD